MKNILKAKLILGLILVLGFGASTTAYAASVTIYFKGSTLNSTGFVGQKTGFWASETSTDVTGSYTYESAGSDIIAGSSIDKFTSSSNPGTWTFSLTLGGTTKSITTTPFSSITLWDEASAGIDRYLFSVGGSTTDGLVSFSVDLRESASPGDAVSGLGGSTATDHPPPLPVLSEFGGINFGFYNGVNDARGNNDLKFRISYLSTTPPGGGGPIAGLPEPGTLALLATGLLVGGVATFRKRFQ